MKLESLSMVPFSGISQAYVVFAGQNIGAGDEKRTKDGLKQSLIFKVTVALICSAVIFVIGPGLIELFVDASETEVISRGTAYLRAFCPFLAFFAITQLYVSFLRGVVS